MSEYFHWLTRRLLIPIRASAEEEYWLTFARSLPPARFVVWLANEVTSSLLVTTRLRNVAELCDKVDHNTSGRLQCNAERFLCQRFSSPYRTRTPYRVTHLFRGLICHNLHRLSHDDQ